MEEKLFPTQIRSDPINSNQINQIKNNNYPAFTCLKNNDVCRIQDT